MLFLMLQACIFDDTYTSQSLIDTSHSEDAIAPSALSHDGKFSVIANPRGVCLWNNVLSTLHIPCLAGENTNHIEIVKIAKDNQSFVISNRITVQRYSLSTGDY